MNEADRTKRYILFAGWRYYPAGGIDDFAGTFDTVEEARAAGKARGAPFSQGGEGNDWWQIVDRETLQEVP